MGFCQSTLVGFEDDDPDPHIWWLGQAWLLGKYVEPNVSTAEREAAVGVAYLEEYWKNKTGAKLVSPFHLDKPYHAEQPRPFYKHWLWPARTGPILLLWRTALHGQAKIYCVSFAYNRDTMLH